MVSVALALVGPDRTENDENFKIFTYYLVTSETNHSKLFRFTQQQQRVVGLKGWVRRAGLVGWSDGGNQFA